MGQGSWSCLGQVQGKTDLRRSCWSGMTCQSQCNDLQIQALQDSGVGGAATGRGVEWSGRDQSREAVCLVWGGGM